MTLIEALEILRVAPPHDARHSSIFLACGFTPLHLKTFLEAELRSRSPHITICTGVFGDLAGNIERLNPASLDGLVVVIEWADLDPRLGLRSLGGWHPSELPDVVESAERAAARLKRGIRHAASSLPAAVCVPTLPLPPIFFTRPEQASRFEVRLRQAVTDLAASIAEQPGARIVSRQTLEEVSPSAQRLDVKADVLTGFPYTVEHAAALAELLALLMAAPAPRKGLITDLDDTLWSGLLGEDGADGVSWDLDHRTHMHGVYQQFLRSLAGAGVLVGVATKNDPFFVQEVFARNDLLIRRDEMFPFEVHWAPKSESVRRILRAWNVSADAVVFIDDSPMEVAEVKAAHPEMECLVFPKGDYQGIWELLKRLRRLFGKCALSDEDSLRLASIRSARNLTETAGALPNASADDFLRAADACVSFELMRDPGDARAFELLNKTNQFNLNGKRMSESEWSRFFRDPAAFLLTASYKDKFGRLGKIAVVLGRKEECAALRGRGGLSVQAWVMSCRAFSRRIEHQCLKFLFEEFDAGNIAFDYRPTPRNGPLQEFLTGVLDRKALDASDVRLSREQFERRMPALFHSVRKAVHV